MFKRKSRAERVADEAWDNLVSAIESAGDVARSVGRRTVDLASEVAGEAQDRLRDGAGSVREVRDSAKGKAGGIKDEAWSRAGNALDALAGRKPRKPWGWIGVALLGGLAVGWAVAASAPKAISAARQLAVGEDDLAPEMEPVPAPVPPGGE